MMIRNMIWFEFGSNFPTEFGTDAMDRRGKRREMKGDEGRHLGRHKQKRATHKTRIFIKYCGNLRYMKLYIYIYIYIYY